MGNEEKIEEKRKELLSRYSEQASAEELLRLSIELDKLILRYMNINDEVETEEGHD